MVLAGIEALHDVIASEDDMVVVTAIYRAMEAARLKNYSSEPPA